MGTLAKAPKEPVQVAPDEGAANPADAPAETAGNSSAVEQHAKIVGVKPADVLASRDYGTHVVVVTRDGRKLIGKVVDNG